MRRLQRVEFDQRIVVQNLGMIRADEAHAAHVGGQGVNLVDVLGCLEAVLPPAQVNELEFIGGGGRILRMFQIRAAHPVASFLR